MGLTQSGEPFATRGKQPQSFPLIEPWFCSQKWINFKPTSTSINQSNGSLSVKPHCKSNSKKNTMSKSNAKW